MIINARTAAGIADGSVTVLFRRWEVPRVRVGGSQVTSAGVVSFDAVEEVPDVTSIPEEDLAAAGLSSREELTALLDRRPGRIHRVSVSHAGPDPRLALRDQLPDAAGLADLARRLTRMDAGPKGAWAVPSLRWIRKHPGVVSTELAVHLDRERWGLKTDIRRLKALGLTISLEVGYRLSPRGEAVVAHLDRTT
ncbi:hypothetical protein [Auraticoccus monumenti]|uniref:ASCH domain-containing protein n=1 Tax=Auraticoccus monumenti TaxID=675864 RepID=A0A1G6SM64_9ACTN|nr:hypothetical protein [Auraticoccus monumenti]SDD17216.1 hypothetical protein SAMN04489747_0351 [Auraticoccus monumenti]